MLWFLGKNENEVNLVEENNNLRKKNLQLENVQYHSLIVYKII
jgi:hypothetical protein